MEKFFAEKVATKAGGAFRNFPRFALAHCRYGNLHSSSTLKRPSGKIPKSTKILTSVKNWCPQLTQTADSKVLNFQ